MLISFYFFSLAQLFFLFAIFRYFSLLCVCVCPAHVIVVANKMRLLRENGSCSQIITVRYENGPLQYSTIAHHSQSS